MTASAEQRRLITEKAGPEKRSVFWVLLLCAAAAAALLLPVFPWIRICGADALYETMKLGASVVKKLQDSYSVFSFLSFVQISKQGVLGFWADRKSVV